MSTLIGPQDQRVRDIIGHLTHQLANGWGAFLVARHIHEARASRQINCAHYFFSISEESCIESALLALSRVIVAHNDSINIQYLLSYVEQNHQAFPSVDEKTLTDSVSRHIQELNNISSLIANIREQRNRTIAHLDRRHVTNPSSVYTHPPLDYREVEQAFGLLLGIINTYSGYLRPSEEIRLDNIDAGIDEDSNYLVRLIEEANRRP